MSQDGTLYFADSLNNRIGKIPSAVTRTTSVGTGLNVFTGGALNDPLGLTISHQREILTTNGNNGFMVGVTPAGQPEGKILLDDNGTPPGAGALFGLAFGPAGLYYVDDATNTLNLLK